MNKKALMPENARPLEEFFDLPHEIARVTSPPLVEMSESFTEKKFSELLSSYLASMPENKSYLKIQAFKDGDIVAGARPEELLKKKTSNVFNALNQLPYSIRLTNFQRVFPELRKKGMWLSKVLGSPVTCNVYISPGNGSRCFVYHTDYQEAVVQQVMGAKEWSFPLDKSGEKALGNINWKKVDQNPDQVERTTLSKGECLYLGHSIVHAAQNRSSELSIHITYGINSTTQLCYANAILKNVLDFDSIGEELLANKTIDFKNCEKTIELLQESLEKMKSNIQMVDFQEESFKRKTRLLKKGRSY